MANVPVTIDITARDNGASSALENLNQRRLDFVNGRYSWVDEPSSGTTSPAGTPGNPTPMNNRMSEDIRREIMQRGVMMVPGSSNFNQLMNIIAQKQLNTSYNEIEKRYSQKAYELNTAKELETKSEKDKVELERQKQLANNPNNAATINSHWDEILEKRLKKINSKYRPQEDALDAQEIGEKRGVREELAKTANEIVQELRKRKDSSYLGQLRQEYQDALWRRDTAKTKEEAKEAGKEADEIQRRISKSMPSNRLTQTLGVFSGVGSVINTSNKALDAYFQNTGMKIGEINSAANGDIFGAMQQDLERQRMVYNSVGSMAGTIVGGILGAIIGKTPTTTGMGMAAGGALGGGAGNFVFNLLEGENVNRAKLGSMWQQQEQRMQQFNELALVTRGYTGNGLNTERQNWMNVLQGRSIGQITSGVNFNDLGYTGEQFSHVMAQRAKQRGFYEDTDFFTLNGEGKYTGIGLAEYTAQQIALERAYNMSEGSLGQYSQFDRYSRDGRHRNNANQDMANLVASLSRLGTIGMSGGQTLRANEFLGYQTQLMEMQKGWMDAPDSNYATRMLLAGQRAFGDNFDNRAISEIGQIENAITHPKEDYSKAILYDVIQNEFEGTRGNLLAIKQKQFSNNPEDRMRLNRAMFNRLTEIYGGVDTTSGYLALSHYTGIEDPDRLKKWVDDITSGSPTITKGDVASDTKPLKEYTSPVSKEMLGFQDATIQLINNSLDRLEGVGLKLEKTFKAEIKKIIEKI